MKSYTLLSGDSIPAFGLGTWKSAPGEVGSAVKTALEIGYRHIDCAFIYQNEAEVGQAIATGGVSRDALWITSKLWNNAHAPEDVLPALKQSLSDLRLDYLDLYLVHWPVRFVRSVIYPESREHYIPWGDEIQSTWEALEKCVDNGLVKNIGVSNFSIKKMQNIMSFARIMPAVNQVEMHPYLQQGPLKAFCDAHGIFLTAYAPLGSADRPENMHKANEPGLLEHELLQDIAKKHGVTTAQVLISWALTRNTVVIPKSVNTRRLQENLDACSLILPAEDMQAINALDSGYRFIDGHFWTQDWSPYTLESLWDGE